MRNFYRTVIAVAVLVPIIVLAQEATSSNDASQTNASTTPVVAATSTDSTQATSTPVQTASTTPQISAPTAQTPQLPQTVDLAAVKTSVESVAALEDQYVLDHNGYLQVLPGDKLAPYEGNGPVSAALGGDVPSDMRVDIYQSPLGWGYQVIYRANAVTYSKGYGPEAKNRTYTILPPTDMMASSTPAVSENSAATPTMSENSTTTSSEASSTPADTTTTEEATSSNP